LLKTLPLRQIIDLDGNGTIDKNELKQLLEIMCGKQGLDLTEDNVHTIFCEIDTDNSGDITPLEFRTFLERTLVEAEARGRQIDLTTLVTTTFHDALVRVKRDHNLALSSFLKASKEVFMCDKQGAAQESQSSMIFNVFHRLMECPLNASLLPTGENGRLAFIIEALREVTGLADVVLSVPMMQDDATRGKEREKATRLIREALFGRSPPGGGKGEDSVSIVGIFRFVQEWLSRIEDGELENGGMGQLATRWVSVKRSLLPTVPKTQSQRVKSLAPLGEALPMRQASRKHISQSFDSALSAMCLSG